MLATFIYRLYEALPKVEWVKPLTQEDQLEPVGSFNLIAALGKRHECWYTQT